MRFSSVACILAASLVFTGCAAKDDDKPEAHVPKSEVTIPAEQVKDELPKVLRSYAVQTPEAAVHLFGIPGQDSLNETLEEATLKALEQAGAFKGRKAFQPEVTPPKERWGEADYLAFEGHSPESESTEGEDAEGQQSGSGDDKASSVESHIVGAGGDFLVTQLDVRSGGQTASRQFLTDTKNNATKPIDSIKAEGVEGEIAVAGDKITVDGEDADDEVLSESGHNLAAVLGEDLTIEAEESPYLPDFTCALLPCAAMTYDDGPADDALTKRLADALDKAKVRATFFEIGRIVEALPENSRLLREAGHEVENHSFTHPVLSKLTPDKQKSEVDKTDKAIHDAGGEYPTMLRPPYGASNKRLDTVAQGSGESGDPAGGKAKKADGEKAEHGKAIIMWDVDTLDWKHRNADRVKKAALANTKPGSIVLMHAIHPTTVDASPEIFSGLQDRGFYLVPVGYMFKGMKLEPGKEYFCRGYHDELCSTPEHPFAEKDS
ncbi:MULTISPECIES: polysaccharide deacetylase family protein [unclassified Brevibacterium]|uniref:polysaccharide deacetylase family protein n=1 Tax=unclassified Brevibacterium TaxID=2614124 RepID=UPI0008A473C8|nr:MULTISPECIES: polysaccharide deacetylase family protein [unclassified Brevibacterium]OFL68700.1 hypothetical protein HMPREF2757_07255 [Brevibacterium sp. HMSC063G07]OFS25880.1 hypothetical protein HMPREF3162_07240 [Brevibacterium sp. HMSC07C04]